MIPDGNFGKLVIKLLETSKVVSLSQLDRSSHAEIKHPCRSSSLEHMELGIVPDINVEYIAVFVNAVRRPKEGGIVPDKPMRSRRANAKSMPHEDTMLYVQKSPCGILTKPTVCQCREVADGGRKRPG
eukprot:SAG31_NODE_13386_length_873_cov_1.080103_1_plen_128_part_00